ncbi:hypothetical protein GGI43DRAFT_431100 [Trichoderma evansii]
MAENHTERFLSPSRKEQLFSQILSSYVRKLETESTERKAGHQITTPTTPTVPTSDSQLSNNSDERSALTAKSLRLTSEEPMPNFLSTEAALLSTQIRELDAKFQAFQKAQLEKTNMLQTRLENIEKLVFLQGSATNKQQRAINEQQSVSLAQKDFIKLLNVRLAVVENETDRLNNRMAEQEDNGI